MRCPYPSFTRAIPRGFDSRRQGAERVTASAKERGWSVRRRAEDRGANDGRRLFHGARPQQLLPGPQYGDAAVLFCFVFLYMAAAGGARGVLTHYEIVEA